MPFGALDEDAVQYGKQIIEVAARYRMNTKTKRGYSKGEYLSGFYKDDVLKPVITLVVHFGANECDAPVSLGTRFCLQQVHFYYYWLAKGIFGILSYAKEGIRLWFKTRCPAYHQLSLKLIA